MPIEIVCKIKFAEEDAKPKEKEAGDEQSLLGAAQGPAAPRDLATFASTSTLHGLGRACAPGPHGLRRTLWALALLTSLAAFLYQAASLARGYLTRPHLVAVDPAAPAPVAGFPAVTLCNINRFRHSALSDADIFHLANLTGLPPKDRDGHRAAGLRYPEPDMVDILNRTGHQLADMLKSCNFSGHHCSASNFSVQLDQGSGDRQLDGQAKDNLIYQNSGSTPVCAVPAPTPLIASQATAGGGRRAAGDGVSLRGGSLWRCCVHGGHFAEEPGAEGMQMRRTQGGEPRSPKETEGGRCSVMDACPAGEAASGGAWPLGQSMGREQWTASGTLWLNSRAVSMEEAVYTRYGKCYTFNADPQSSLPSRAGGMGSGLEIMLDIQQEEYLPIWRETNETSFEAGIRVQIHSQEEPPYIHQLGFGVSPGFQTFVSCQEQRLTYLPQPWGNCRAESELREPELQGYSAYSVSACRLRCEKEAVLQRCHCRMVHMPGNETICPPNIYIECADHTLDSLGGGSEGPCFCPTPCNLTRYGKEISMVKMPNRGSARYLARKYNRNETYIRENFLVLDVFFEALTSEAMEQRAAYGLSALLGDLGGQMGLFIGASVLTLLEILDYIYEVSWDRLKRVWRRPKPPLRTSTGGISTLGLQELKEQSPCPSRGRVEGGGASSLLPNHHHPHGPPGSLFEDFAC
ncbi:acid-sensing ion channel 4 isoform X2 [Cricetulus griseus]|uniref:Acid-sensing ion channel 4 isoform X2 n=1 Tax=Cricetulus griseus TaxID=10029 RepID=A0A9J7GLL2_CRIGR|nr:acid-sensing ion channel 4 isoform X2 [Cricetulus griseus]